MKLVKDMFNELIVSSVLLQLMDAFFSGMMFFAIGIFILSFLGGFPLYYSAIPALPFFVFSFFKKLKVNKIIKLEDNYPQLREKLRTSKDYRDKENTVVSVLHTEVLNLVNKADINALLDKKMLAIKIGLISFFFFMTLFITSVGFNAYDLSKMFSKTPISLDAIRARTNNFMGKDPDLSMTQDLLKEGSMAQLGDKELNLSLDVFDTEVDITQIEKPKKNDFGESFPDEAEDSGQEIYNEEITEEHKEVIKNYFDKIKG
ncbi:MAG: hypothetical protein V1859_00895 [archaeon]